MPNPHKSKGRRKLDGGSVATPFVSGCTIRLTAWGGSAAAKSVVLGRFSDHVTACIALVRLHGLGDCGSQKLNNLFNTADFEAEILMRAELARERARRER